MVFKIEYLDHKGDTQWRESKADWSDEDLRFLNKVCGYTKYRARMVNQ